MKGGIFIKTLRHLKRPKFSYQNEFGSPLQQLSDGVFDVYIKKIDPLKNYGLALSLLESEIEPDFKIAFDSEWQLVNNVDILITQTYAFRVKDDLYAVTYHNRNYYHKGTVSVAKLLLYLNKLFDLNLGIFTERVTANYEIRDGEYRKAKVQGTQGVCLIGYFTGVDIRYTDIFEALKGHDGDHSNNTIVKVLHRHCFTMQNKVVLNTRLWHRSNQYECYMWLKVRDTLLLLPDKTSLDDACKAWLGVTKKDNINENEIKLMGLHLFVNSKRYSEYAIKDPIVTLFLHVALVNMYEDNSITLPAVAVNKYIQSIGLEKKKDYKYIRGYDFDEEYRIYHALDEDFKDGNVKIMELTEFCKILTEERVYKGGCNQCHTFGATNVHSLDIDYTGAYGVAMSSIPEYDLKDLTIIKDTEITNIPNHEEMFALERITNIGLAIIDFELPPDKYNTEPCYTSKGDVYYVLDNKRAVVGYPMLVALYNTQAKIYIHQLLIPNQNTKKRHPLSKHVIDKTHERRDAIKKYGKGAPEELVFKYLINTLYGKIGQGVNEKFIKEYYGDETKSLPHNAISDPFLACHITAFTRAMMMLNINYLKTNFNKKVLSITTDGYNGVVTREELDSIENYLKSIKPLKDLIDVLGIPSFCEIKHEQDTLLNIKTRFGISGLNDTKGVFASVGMKMPRKNMTDLEKKQMILDKLNNKEMHFKNVESNIESLKAIKDQNLKSLTKEEVTTIRLFHDARMIPHTFEDDYGVLLRIPRDYEEYCKTIEVHKDICYYEYCFDFFSKDESIEYIELYTLALEKRRRYKIKDFETWVANELRIYKYYNQYSNFKHAKDKDDLFNEINACLRNAKFKILTRDEFNKIWSHTRKSDSIDFFINKYNLDAFLADLKKKLNNKRSKQRRKQTTP